MVFPPYLTITVKPFSIWFWKKIFNTVSYYFIVVNLCMEFAIVSCYCRLYSLQYWKENDLKLNTESFVVTAPLGWQRKKKARGLNRFHTMTIILNPPGSSIPNELF